MDPMWGEGHWVGCESYFKWSLIQLTNYNTRFSHWHQTAAKLWNYNSPHHMTHEWRLLPVGHPASTHPAERELHVWTEGVLFSTCRNVFRDNTRRRAEGDIVVQSSQEGKSSKVWQTELIFMWPFQHWKVGFKSTDRCQRKNRLTDWECEG